MFLSMSRQLIAGTWNEGSWRMGSPGPIAQTVPRFPHRVFMQGPEYLPLVRYLPDGQDGRPHGRQRTAPSAVSAVGALGAQTDPVAPEGKTGSGQQVTGIARPARFAPRVSEIGWSGGSLMWRAQGVLTATPALAA